MSQTKKTETAEPTTQPQNQTIMVREQSSLFSGCLLILIWSVLCMGIGYMIHGWVV